MRKVDFVERKKLCLKSKISLFSACFSKLWYLLNGFNEQLGAVTKKRRKKNMNIY